MQDKYMLSEKQTTSIIEFSGDIISDDSEFKAHQELFSKWNKWTKREKLKGKKLTVDETIKLPQLIFKNISKLPMFLSLVLSYMRVGCVDLTESTILDYTELDELRRILSENWMDFYETVKLSRESKISLIRGDLLTKDLSEDRAVYEIVLNALVRKDVTVHLEDLLIDKIPNCIKLLSEQNIYIKKCNNLSDLSSLAGCRNMQSLWIDSCDKLTSLSGLADPCPLNWRTYDSYKHLVDIHFPEGQQYLDGMRFWFNVGANDHHVFDKRSGIREIHIIDCNNITDISILENCIDLSTFYIRNCKKVHDLSSLNNCSGLSQLIVSGCDNINQPTLEKLEGRCKRMDLALKARESLTKEEMAELDKKCNRIRHAIQYEENYPIKAAPRDEIGFEEPCYDGQEDLYISDNKNRETMEELQENHNIKRLCLDNLENLKNLSGINQLPNINELDIISLENLVDLKGLETLTKLHMLGLKCLSKLTDMQSLGYLPSLKVLSTDDNDGRLRALDGIEQSSSIEAVGLDGVFANTNLQALERLPKLKMVVIYKKQTTTNKFGINDGLMTNLKSLALSAGVELLQAQGCVDEDGSEKRSQEPGFIKLGCFQHTSNLTSNMASMAENEMSAGTAFVATTESPLPIISPKELLSRISFSDY